MPNMPPALAANARRLASAVGEARVTQSILSFWVSVADESNGLDNLFTAMQLGHHIERRTVGLLLMGVNSRVQ